MTRSTDAANRPDLPPHHEPSSARAVRALARSRVHRSAANATSMGWVRPELQYLAVKAPSPAQPIDHPGGTQQKVNLAKRLVAGKVLIVGEMVNNRGCASMSRAIMARIQDFTPIAVPA